jgi:hypothetical protein
MLIVNKILKSAVTYDVSKWTSKITGTVAVGQGGKVLRVADMCISTEFPQLLSSKSSLRYISSLIQDWKNGLRTGVRNFQTRSLRNAPL